MKLIQINRHGGPEVLEWADAPEPVVGSGQALIRQTAIGLNFIDTYHRMGWYPLPRPLILGQEGAGVVDAVGDDASHAEVGVGVAEAVGEAATENP